MFTEVVRHAPHFGGMRGVIEAPHRKFERYGRRRPVSHRACLMHNTGPPPADYLTTLKPILVKIILS